MRAQPDRARFGQAEPGEARCGGGSDRPGEVQTRPDRREVAGAPLSFSAGPIAPAFCGPGCQQALRLRGGVELRVIDALEVPELRKVSVIVMRLRFRFERG